MNTVLILNAIISIIVAAPTSKDAQARIIHYENNDDGRGNYQFSFETSNGISRKESGRVVNVGEPDEHLEVQGEYSYTDAEGQLVVVHYTADDTGYHTEEGVPLPEPLPPLTPVGAPLPPAAVASLLG